MDGVTDPSLQYHTEQLHCSKNPPSPPTQSLPTSPWQPLIFLLCLVLTFSECHRVGGTQLIAFSDWLLSPRGGGCLVAESCLTLCNPMDCSFSADGISQARILNRLPFPSPGDLPDPGIEPPSPASAGRFFTTEPPGKSRLLSPSHMHLRLLYVFLWLHG